MAIRDLFDTSAGKRIDRRIEKVIQFDSTAPELLAQEIGEYVVTDHIASRLEKLLDLLDRGMDGAASEVGVWVSGFYGSGKSSFAKYLGFALNLDFQLAGRPFLEHLQDRIASLPLRQRLSTVAKTRHPAVIMLDLASEQLAGATMAEISTVLYAKVMQWAGYSRDRKIAYLEFMLEKDGKLDEFRQRISALANGKSWEDIKNQPLVANQLASRLACELYPDIFPDGRSFQEMRLHEDIKEDDRVREMIDLVRRRTGRQNVIFVLDEVGQYIAAKDALILNLDGLARNVKSIGQGRAWILATAQQTLTEDDPKAQLNTPKLFKLKDRFPIQIDLEASDIREICYLRLLGKSPQGKAVLEKLFADTGQQLRFHTALKNTRYYKRDLDRDAFCELYPFLPQHFDILLELLGRLSKSIGGIGLRSAIKVIQDVLVNPDSVPAGVPVLADKPVGGLATGETFYDSLRRDIQRSFRYIVEGVDKVVHIYGNASTEARAAKTVAVLQVLDDFPVTRENVAAMLHPSVDAPSQLEAVDQAIDALLDEEAISFNEVEGSLRFMTEAVSEIEAERRSLIPSLADRSRIFHAQLREIFTPLPRAMLAGTRTVQAGVKVESRATGSPVSIAGDKEEVQLILHLVPEAEHDTERHALIQASMHQAERHFIHLLGRDDPEVASAIDDVYRCETTYERYRHKAAEREVSEYLRAQEQRAAYLLTQELRPRLEKALLAGSFVFRGKPHAVAARAREGVRQAADAELADAARQIYDKYAEAPVQAETLLAERFLKTDRLDRIESRNDPLGLAGPSGQVNTSHPALRSVTDHLRTRGMAEGRSMMEHFSSAPFGWSKDTLRYIVAALLVAGEVKLRVSGEDIQVRGSKAYEALRSNQSFSRVGVALRDGRLDPANLLRAADRLLELTGSAVLPLEDAVSQAVARHFPDLQRDYAPLGSRLRALGLPGSERAQGIQDSLSEILKGDASDAAARLGPEQCELYADLRWAGRLRQALYERGLDCIATRAQVYLRGIPVLPAVGATLSLQQNTETLRQELGDCLGRENVYDYVTDLQGRLAQIEVHIQQAARELTQEHEVSLSGERARLEGLPDWLLIGQEDQDRIANRLDRLELAVEPTVTGLQGYINARYQADAELRKIEQEVHRLASALQPNELNDRPKPLEFKLPREIASTEDLRALIERLEAVVEQLRQGSKVKLTF
jgi:uncharacterized protein DUF6079